MTDFLAYPIGGHWTSNDLQLLPNNGLRYEISDGRLIVSPPPAKPHFSAVTQLRRLLDRQAPPGLVAGENAGVSMASGRTIRIPDLVVIHESAMTGREKYFQPSEVLLAVEVLSPDSAGDDLLTKRHQYGRAGIPHYWIVDQKTRLLRVLRHDGDEGYLDQEPIPAGQKWQTQQPFPLILDPAEFI